MGRDIGESEIERKEGRKEGERPVLQLTRKGRGWCQLSK